MDIESNDNLGSKIIKKGLWQYIFFVFIAPSGYVIKLILTNSLSVSDVGILYAIINLIGLLSVYNDLWLTESLQYFIPRYAIKKEIGKIRWIVRFTLGMQLVSGILIGWWLYLASDWLAVHYFDTASAWSLLRLFSVYFLWFNILQTCWSLFMSYQKVIHNNIVELTRIRSTILILIGLIYRWSITIRTASIAWLGGVGIGILISIILGLLFYKKIFLGEELDIRISSIQTWMCYAVWVFLGANVSAIFWQVDQLILLWLGWSEQAWYYVGYLTIVSMYSMIIGPFMALIYPIITQLIAEDNKEKLQVLLHVTYKFIGLIAFIFVTTVFLLGPEIAVTLFGEKFRFSGHLVQFWIWFYLIVWYNILHFTLYAAYWFVQQRVYLTLKSLAVNILCILLWYYIGWIYWFIIGTGIGITFMTFLSWYFIYKKGHLLIDVSFILYNLIISIIIWVVLYYIMSFLPFANIHRAEGLIYIATIGLIVSSILLTFNWKYLKNIYSILGNKFL